MIGTKLTAVGLAALLLAGCAANPGGSGQLGDSCGELGWGRIGGTLAGATGGAFLGSAFRGAGRSTQGAAIAVGALAGAAAGFFAGNSIDKGQCEQAMMARNRALDQGQIGQSIAWNQGEARGTFTPTREGRDQSGALCKEYEQTIYVDGKAETGIGRACRRPDGRWQIVND
ncbi:hypothetical protein [Elstera cyanobacteriorum]|uniref:17 kDa surface antigen n=1 Tax=Elstera cyanobacteriorum TaxID=2022747 RepID=A0A255XV95_9PROT|nr:hypothetical protein [Elstera cyanobacteriorum]MCK6443701.1 hypothetical protein [Elstera cyanobacteriorum]OYQ20906.1 hypothetical protein CHR90_02920 [Elstera cyanobacteriorum]GFZ97405.1 hypothetical protein GCM10011497_29900 [Elstera cyanobacteriorum]